MKNRDDDFSELVGRFLNLWKDVKASMFVLEFGLEKSTKELAEFNRKGFLSLMAEPEFKHALGDLDVDTITDQTTKINKQLAAKRIKAFGIVCAHSILDAVLDDLLKLCAILDPDIMVQFIKNKKIDYGLIIDKTKEQILSEFITNYLEGIKKQSLVKKIGILFSICKLTTCSHPMSDYAYDQNEILRIDQLRQDIVHGMKFDNSMDDTEKILLYLQNTGNFFIFLVADKFDLKFRIPIIMSNMLTP
jgi:hypothetical protein